MNFKKRWRTLWLILLITLVVTPLLVKADIYLKQKSHTDAFKVMGRTQPAKDEMVVMWMGKDKGRIDQGEKMSTIIRLDKNIMYMVDHNKKTYSEMPFSGLNDLISSSLAKSDLSKEEQAEAKKFMGFAKSMMKVEVKVTDTGETKKIKAWNCRKYLMTTKVMMTSSTSEIWATEDIKLNADLFRTLGFSLMAKQPGFDKAFEEMKKIKGISVLTTSTSSVMGAKVKSTQELLEVKEARPPAGIYEVPAGYKKES